MFDLNYKPGWIPTNLTRTLRSQYEYVSLAPSCLVADAPKFSPGCSCTWWLTNEQRKSCCQNGGWWWKGMKLTLTKTKCNLEYDWTNTKTPTGQSSGGCTVYCSKGRFRFDSRSGQTKRYKNWYSQILHLTFCIKKEQCQASSKILHLVSSFRLWPDSR